VKIYILQSLSFGGHTIYRPHAYHKENHKHNGEYILYRSCVLLLSAAFVQIFFLYDKYLASYAPDALRKVSKLSDFKQNWSAPNIKL